jgi:hypothetical protein
MKSHYNENEQKKGNGNQNEVIPKGKMDPDSENRNKINLNISKKQNHLKKNVIGERSVLGEISLLGKSEFGVRNENKKEKEDEDEEMIGSKGELKKVKQKIECGTIERVSENERDFREDTFYIIIKHQQEEFVKTRELIKKQMSKSI